MADSNNPKSNERRITVLPALWPKLEEFAQRDGLSVANVANAILLQNLRPYGGCIAANGLTPSATTIDNPTAHQEPARPQQPDPYQTADIDSW